MEDYSNEINTEALMIIKPDGMTFLSQILKSLCDHELSICSMKYLMISSEQARDVYRQHEGKYYFNTLVEYLTMEPSLLLAIKGTSKNIMESKKSIRILAKQEAENTRNEALTRFLRDLSVTEKVKANLGDLVEKFNTEYVKTFDGIHCSDIGEGKRELAIFFENNNLLSPHFNTQRASEIIRNKLIERPTPPMRIALDEVSDQLNHFTFSNQGE